MKYKIEENAIDSLKFAMRFFDQFFDTNDTSVMKHVIMYLENAVELLLKCLLISDNPLSIYESKCTQTVKEAENKATDTLTLAEILIRRYNIKTIGYENAIKKFCNSHDENEKVRMTLSKLGEYRNAIMHFGIDADEKLDDLICCIFSVFDVISNDLYEYLIAVDEYFTYNDFLDEVEDKLEGSIDYISSLCISNPGKNIRPFIDMFKRVISSTEFKDAVDACGISVEFHNMDYNLNSYWIGFFKDGEYLTEWISYYSWFHNATIFTDDSGGTYFVFEHTENVMYSYRTYSNYSHIYEKEGYYPWRKDKDEGKCYSKKLHYKNLVDQMVEFLKSAPVIY